MTYPGPKSCKSICPGDICLAGQVPDFNQLERVLTQELTKLDQYRCTQEQQEKNLASKTKAGKKLAPRHSISTMQKLPENIHVSGITLEHAPNPTYLGAILNRTIAFKDHFKGIAAKGCPKRLKTPATYHSTVCPWRSPISTWCQTMLNRSLVLTAQGDSGQPSTDLGLGTACTWPALTDGAAAPCSLCACGEEQTMEHTTEACPLQ